MKKILYLHQYFSTPDSFAGTRSFDLSSFFIKANYKVVVLCAKGYINEKYITKKGWNVVNIYGIEVHILNKKYSQKQNFYSRIYAFIYFSFMSYVHALTMKFDIILASSTPLTIGIPAILLKMTRRKSLLTELRDIWPDAAIAIGELNNSVIKKSLFFFEKLLYSLSDQLVVLSSDMKDNLLAKGVENTKINVIENIAHIDRFEKIKNKKTFNLLSAKFLLKKKVVYTGTLGKVNGVSYMVYLAKAMLEINNDVVFLVWGDGNELEKIISIAKDIGVYNKNFFIYPPVSKEELPGIISFADITCSWVINKEELWMNSANKYFDALAAGKPIVINYMGWQAEEIKKQNFGVCLSPLLEDINLSARILYDVIKNKELLNTMGKNAKKMAIQKYSLNYLGNKYLNVLEKV